MPACAQFGRAKLDQACRTSVVVASHVAQNVLDCNRDVLVQMKCKRKVSRMSGGIVLKPGFESDAVFFDFEIVQRWGSVDDDLLSVKNVEDVHGLLFLIV